MPDDGPLDDEPGPDDAGVGPGRLPAGDPPPRPTFETTPTPPPTDHRHVPHDEGPLSPHEERVWAALAHLGEVAFLVFAPVLVLLAVGKRSVFVADQAAQAFNFQVTVLLAYVVAVVLAIAGLGPLTLAAVWVVGLVSAVVAAVRAYSGDLYRYPVSLRLMR